jgi:hypothetical protein
VHGNGIYRYLSNYSIIEGSNRTKSGAVGENLIESIVGQFRLHLVRCRSTYSLKYRGSAE